MVACPFLMRADCHGTGSLPGHFVHVLAAERSTGRTSIANAFTL